MTSHAKDPAKSNRSESLWFCTCGQTFRAISALEEHLFDASVPE